MSVTSVFGNSWLNLKMTSAVVAEMTTVLQKFTLHTSENRNYALNSSPPPKKN
jgi:hypothetical protein